MWRWYRFQSSCKGSSYYVDLATNVCAWVCTLLPEISEQEVVLLHFWYGIDTNASSWPFKDNEVHARVLFTVNGKMVLIVLKLSRYAIIWLTFCYWSHWHSTIYWAHDEQLLTILHILSVKSYAKSQSILDACLQLWRTSAWKTGAFAWWRLQWLQVLTIHQLLSHYKNHIC